VESNDGPNLETMADARLPGAGISVSFTGIKMSFTGAVNPYPFYYRK